METETRRDITRERLETSGKWALVSSLTPSLSDCDTVLVHCPV